MDILGIGNSELAMCDMLGKTIVCPHCERRHKVRVSDPPDLQFYRCGKGTYLCGIDGRNIMPCLRTNHARPAVRPML
jgi:hypothetical protein